MSAAAAIAGRRALLVAQRELGAEGRQADGAMAALTFVALVVVLESLVLGPGLAREPRVGAAAFWIALAFAALLATARSFDRELEDDAIDAVLSLPGGRDALYVGKVLALVLLLLGVGGGAGVLALVLLDLPLALPGHAALALGCGVLSLPPVVVLVTALTLRLRARALAVPLLALPLLLAQLLGATHALAGALIGDGAVAVGWSLALIAVALVETTLGLTIVPAAIE
jgi:heme exporter protein B